MPLSGSPVIEFDETAPRSPNRITVVQHSSVSSATGENMLLFSNFKNDCCTVNLFLLVTHVVGGGQQLAGIFQAEESLSLQQHRICRYIHIYRLKI
jgi:hypothetical protein